MPVPPIAAPDAPQGLDEALRGPLSPVPEKRPQRAIEVAWLLQDAQRLNGFAVTEPVVLDLDDIEHHRSPIAGETGRRPLPGASIAVPPVPVPDPWGAPPAA